MPKDEKCKIKFKEPEMQMKNEIEHAKAKCATHTCNHTLLSNISLERRSLKHVLQHVSTNV